MAKPIHPRREFLKHSLAGAPLLLSGTSLLTSE